MNFGYVPYTIIFYREKKFNLKIGVFRRWNDLFLTKAAQ